MSTEEVQRGKRTRAVEFATSRTVVRLADEDDASAIVDFYTRNRERLRPFDPERSPIFYEERFWRIQVQTNQVDFEADRALRLFVFPADDPRRVIGSISFSNFVRGVGQYCTLGYTIDAESEGKGLMRESLQAAIHYVFRAMGVHRIEANYMPHNVRSGGLLRRLGFVVEGYSRDYLMINGRWEDHVRAALINPHWHH